MSTSIEQNKAVIRRFIDAWNSRRPDAFDEVVAADVVRHCEATPGLEANNLDQIKEFLRQDTARRDEGYNIWRLPVNPRTGRLASDPIQVSDFTSAAFSSLTGTADGKRMMMIRSDYATHTYVADWRGTPTPSLVSVKRLTIEQSNTYPHTWSADSQSVIFESDQTGNLELFEQNFKRREPERLTYSKTYAAGANCRTLG